MVAANLLDLAVSSKLVGVIDVRHGIPVHAVAGCRSRYRPIQLPHASKIASSSALVDHYRALGLDRLYVADLDGLSGGMPQWDALNRIVACCSELTEVTIDVGWSGDESARCCHQIVQLASFGSGVRFVAASESAVRIEAPLQLAERIGPERVALGFDYRDGRWISRNIDERAWFDICLNNSINKAVVLDLGTVGTRSGPITQKLVKRMKQENGGLRILSGGGVRGSEDVCELLQAGCSGCLVATALQRIDPAAI